MSYGNIDLNGTQQEIVAKSVSSPPRIGLLLRNNGSATVFLGEDSSVTVLNGYPLEAGEELIIDFDGAIAPFFYRDAVHGITGGTTVDTRYWEMTQTR
jgi:hypothetical protein